MWIAMLVRIEVEGGKESRNTPISHDNGTIFGCLLESVVPDAICGVVGGSSAQNCEFAFHVAVHEWKKGQRWKENLRHEGGYYCCESCCNSKGRGLSERSGRFITKQ
jgi:hypothetical protein